MAGLPLFPPPDFFPPAFFLGDFAFFGDLGFLGEAAFFALGFAGDFFPAAGFDVPALIDLEAAAEAFRPDPARDPCLGTLAAFFPAFFLEGEVAAGAVVVGFPSSPIIYFVRSDEFSADGSKI